MGSLYSYEIESQIPMPRLNAARGTRGTITVKRSERTLRDTEGELTAYAETVQDGALAFARVGERLLITCDKVGWFLLDPEALVIEVDSEAEDRLIEARVVVVATLTLLAMHGDLVIHASAVDAGGAVLFCGDSGRGKSTLVDALGRGGHFVLSEDGVAISNDGSGSIAHPGARGIRLRHWLTGGSGGLAADPSPSEPTPAKVRALVALEPRGEELEVRQLTPTQAVAKLAPSLVHGGRPADLAPSFAALSTLLGAVPAYSARLPDDLDRIDASAAALMDGVGGIV